MEATAGRYPFPPYANGWFRVAYSDELAPGEVEPLSLLGRELVLFRTESGQARLLDAYCRHLGAHLGVGGFVEGENLRCPFHHWAWSGEGRCVDIPYAKRIPPKAEIRSWPLVEKNGIIAVYHHAQNEAPGWELPDLPQIGGEEWSPLHVKRWRVKAQWLDMNENAVDQAHFLFVHKTRTMPQTEAKVDGHVLRCESSFTQKAPGGEATGTLVTKDYGPAFQTVEMSGIIDTLMMNTATPIDERETDLSFAYTVRTQGDPRKEKLARAMVDDLENQFEADRPIWENKMYWQRPVLCDGDGPFNVYRKWLQQFF